MTNYCIKKENRHRWVVVDVANDKQSCLNCHTADRVHHATTMPVLAVRRGCTFLSHTAIRYWQLYLVSVIKQDFVKIQLHRFKKWPSVLWNEVFWYGDYVNVDIARTDDNAALHSAVIKAMKVIHGHSFIPVFTYDLRYWLYDYCIPMHAQI